ncbi:hypothetical protein ACU8KH_01719 [Lachancea thermotolerans]
MGVTRRAPRKPAAGATKHGPQNHSERHRLPEVTYPGFWASRMYLQDSSLSASTQVLGFACAGGNWGLATRAYSAVPELGLERAGAGGAKAHIEKINHFLKRYAVWRNMNSSVPTRAGLEVSVGELDRAGVVAQNAVEKLKNEQ